LILAIRFRTWKIGNIHLMKQFETWDSLATLTGVSKGSVWYSVTQTLERHYSTTEAILDLRTLPTLTNKEVQDNAVE